MKVKTPFTDRDTGDRYAKGDEYTGTPARLAELQSGGYLYAGPIETPDDGPADTKGVSADEARASTGRKPADARATRKR